VLVAGEMLFVPAAYAVVGKIARPEDRGKSMGLLGLCGALGSSCGPLLGGVLLDRFALDPFYVWGPVALPAFLAAGGFALWRKYGRAEAAVSTKITAPEQ
jgi:MFS family permease